MVKSITFSVFVTLLLLVLCEGVASLVLATYDAIKASSRPGVLERIHTEYDPELGWVNLPSFFDPDMYGPGEYLRTNSSRFRSDQETPVAVPSGKVRVICSGDSFTMGYGVANNEAWCSRLADLDPKIEAVNMGQGGYGIDQAYLWYKRDGLAIEHNVVVFAFVNTDFDRMMSSVFYGYGKPYLTIVDGKLELTNVPVTQPAVSKWAADMNDVLVGFRVFQFFARLSGRLESSRHDSIDMETRTLDTVALIMEDMARRTRAAGVEPLFVFLPTLGGEEEIEATKARREFVRAAAMQKGVTFLDLVERSTSMFGGGHLPLHPRHGHYSVAGNWSVAEELYGFMHEQGLIAGQQH